MKTDGDIVMTDAEEAFIDRFTADYCRPHHAVMAERLAAFVAARRRDFLSSAAVPFAFAAGPRPSAAAPVRAPDEEVRFVFAGDGAGGTAWRATVTVPPGATAETMIAVAVAGPSGAPAEGMFTLAGCNLPLAGGRAEMPFGQFLAGIRETDVTLRAPSAPPAPGRLLFF